MSNSFRKMFWHVHICLLETTHAPFTRHSWSRTRKWPPARPKSHANSRDPNWTSKMYRTVQWEEVKQKTTTIRQPLRMCLTITAWRSLKRNTSILQKGARLSLSPSSKPYRSSHNPRLIMGSMITDMIYGHSQQSTSLSTRLHLQTTRSTRFRSVPGVASPQIKPGTTRMTAYDHLLTVGQKTHLIPIKRHNVPLPTCHPAFRTILGRLCKHDPVLI